MDFKDSSVKSATGKSLDDWFKIIAKNSGEHSTHKDIADFLHEQFEITYWWAQEITVLYEKDIGRRITGQTQGGLFQVGVSKTFQHPTDTVWGFLTSPKGLKLIVGDDPDPGRIEDLEGSSPSGTSYKMTTYKPFSHIRMQWKLPYWKSYSILQIRVTAKENSKTTLSFHQERLVDSDAREEMRRHWQETAEAMIRSLNKTHL